MEIKSEQELVAAIHLQRLAREATLLKRAKAGASWSWSSVWGTGLSVLLAGLLLDGSSGLLAGHDSLRAGAMAGIFALVFVIAGQAHARVNALVELLGVRGDMASTMQR